MSACVTEAEKYVVRAAWQVFRNLGYSLDEAVVFNEALIDQIEKWHADDATADPDVAA